MTVLVFLFSLCGAMALGMPVAFALLVCGLALMLWLGQVDAQILAQNLVIGADNFQLLAIPFFLLAGELMNAGGLSKRIVNFALAWVGHLHGGLGYVAIIAAVIMASLSGSAAADTAALAAILIPMMRQAGYPVGRSAGLICSGGIIAPVIPPSIGFIVFGVAANVSITRLFVAGVFPGILMGVTLAITWWFVARRDKVATFPKLPFRARFQSILDGFWALLMPVFILGGIRFGVVTPTEAAVVAAVYALIIGMFVYRELKPRELYDVLLISAKSTASIMFLVAAALVSAWLITGANIPGEISGVLQPLIERPKLLMAAMMVLVIIVGTALDFAPTVLILTPILMPLVRQAGIDPVYFGVLFIINNAIGLLTPPVGIVLNVVSGVARVPMWEVMKGVWPFFVTLTALLFLMVVFPEIVTVPARFILGR
ncbi:TRAP transporter large permease subunit [Roseomonas sp. CCTCC AB2023176]|uniref:TRAP transporter large permease subunit n=1 Tax=Roseomonas sp. CCTCC AB2023176 TaxID=3342640 RepID=UPI0035D78FB7